MYVKRHNALNGLFLKDMLCVSNVFRFLHFGGLEGNDRSVCVFYDLSAHLVYMIVTSC